MDNITEIVCEFANVKNVFAKIEHEFANVKNEFAEINFDPGKYVFGFANVEDDLGIFTIHPDRNGFSARPFIVN